MQLPTVFRQDVSSLPPMYAWPRAVKQCLLAFSVVAVIGAYILLAGGIIAVLAIEAERMGS